MNELMDIDELTSYLSLSRETIEGLLKCWDFPVIDAGGQSRFNRDDVDAWMIKKGRKAGGKRMSALDDLKGDIDPLTKRIVFTGILTAELEQEGFSPVAAGNYAVELYTSGGYKGDSVDIIAPIELTDKVLTRLDFKKENGSWRNEDVDISVNVLAEDVEEHQLERVNQIDINGLTGYLLGVDDVILSKLQDFSRRGESNAIIWVQELMEIHVNEIDLDYLKDYAAQEGTMGALQKLIDELRLEEEEYAGKMPQS